MLLARGDFDTFAGMKNQVMILDLYGEFAFQNVETLARMGV
jgi:hypothetical protein